jgi:hypothetical protein
MQRQHNTTHQQIYDYVVEHRMQENLVVAEYGMNSDNHIYICHHCGKEVKFRQSMLDHFKIEGNYLIDVFIGLLRTSFTTYLSFRQSL